MNIRKDSGPTSSLNKPDLFFCADDIVDLSVGWDDSNAGVDLLTNSGLTNDDIIIL